MNRIIKILVLVILIMGLNKSKAQDAHFSQYYASGLYLNPAISGIEQDLMVGVNYRSQWRSIVIPYVTSQVSLIAPFYLPKSRKTSVHIGGAGLSVYNDRAGDGKFNTTGVNINGAYNLHLSSLHMITFGVQGGFIQKSLDFDNLQWGEQFNPYMGFDASIPPTEPTISSSRLYSDIGAGFVYSYQASDEERTFTAFLGGSAFHINRANESLVKGQISRLPTLFKIHGGLEFPVGERFALSPNVLGMIQNNVYQVNTGVYVTYELITSQTLLPSELIFGTWYRLDDSFICSVGLGNKNYLFGFSYDFNASSLRYSTQGKGAYELSLSIRKVKDRKVIRRFHTPRI